MAQRTSTTAVQTLLGRNYDSSISLQPPVDWATVIVDRVVICATKKGITLGDTELELIERYLAAHGYTATDPLYTSRSTGKASGSFLRGKMEPEPFKARAEALDPSGCLRGILEGSQTASLTWLGKPPSEQIPYQQRD